MAARLLAMARANPSTPLVAARIALLLCVRSVLDNPAAVVKVILRRALER
jgi:hypothetical protein